MNELELKELDETYNQLHSGSITPNFMMGRCPICNGYVQLVRNDPLNTIVCQCFIDYINKK